MKQSDVLAKWIDELSDSQLMTAFDQCLTRDEISLMWCLANEIEKRQLSI